MYLRCERLVELTGSFRPATPSTAPQAIYRAAFPGNLNSRHRLIGDLYRIRSWNYLDE